MVWVSVWCGSVCSVWCGCVCGRGECVLWVSLWYVVWVCGVWCECVVCGVGECVMCDVGECVVCGVAEVCGDRSEGSEGWAWGGQ